MKLSTQISRELVWVLEGGGDRDDFLDELSRHIAEIEGEVGSDKLLSGLITRECKGATSTPEGVAFPHAMIEGISRTFVVAALVKGGIEFGGGHCASDIIFVLIGPPDAAWEHISTLARLARICHSTGALERFRGASSGDNLYEMICDEDNRIVG